MMMSLHKAAAVIVCALLLTPLSITAADATQRPSQLRHCDNNGKCVSFLGSTEEFSARRHLSGSDPRPSRWCGWWLRQQLGVTDRSFNLARRWARYGSPAHGPAPGVIAVWPHHVGIVTGVPSARTIMLKSGNDGHAVRERERSSRGVIAWRYPHGGMASR